MNYERAMMIKAAKRHVTRLLEGRAKKIICLDFPCALV